MLAVGPALLMGSGSLRRGRQHWWKCPRQSLFHRMTHLVLKLRHKTTSSPSCNMNVRDETISPNLPRLRRTFLFSPSSDSRYSVISLWNPFDHKILLRTHPPPSPGLVRKLCQFRCSCRPPRDLDCCAIFEARPDEHPVRLLMHKPGKSQKEYSRQVHREKDAGRKRRESPSVVPGKMQ